MCGFRELIGHLSAQQLGAAAAEISGVLEHSSREEYERKKTSLRRHLRVGVHSDVEVTNEGEGQGQSVTQVCYSCHVVTDFTPD